MNEFQQIFALSMISNMAQNLVNVPNITTTQEAAAAMQTQLATDIPGYLTDFGLSGVTVAWGPSVYVAATDFTPNGNSGSATATNTIVVFNLEIDGVNTYVTAIAGTKPTSAFDATMEDGSITSTVAWAFGTPAGLSPKISNGTNIGVNILLTMTDPTTGLLISDYFAGTSINNSSNAVVFTGHSLGGALAPALGLALFGTAATVSPELKQAARLYATAGPDIGTPDYVTYVEQSFPPTEPVEPAWQQYNRKIWNSLDVVPHAWAYTNLGLVKSIYQTYGLNTPQYVDCVITFAQANSYVQSYADMDPNLTGQFQGTYIAPASTAGYDCGSCSPAKDADNADLCDFVAEMLHQHIAGYLEEILNKTPNSNIDPCMIATDLYNKNICHCAHVL